MLNVVYMICGGNYMMLGCSSMYYLKNKEINMHCWDAISALLGMRSKNILLKTFLTSIVMTF